ELACHRERHAGEEGEESPRLRPGPPPLFGRRLSGEEAVESDPRQPLGEDVPGAVRTAWSGVQHPWHREDAPHQLEQRGVDQRAVRVLRVEPQHGLLPRDADEERLAAVSALEDPGVGSEQLTGGVGEVCHGCDPATLTFAAVPPLSCPPLAVLLLYRECSAPRSLGRARPFPTLARPRACRSPLPSLTPS